MILITGATGFVGKRLLKKVEGAVASPSLRNKNLDEIKRIIDESGADTIIHTAAVSDIGECDKDPEASYLANVILPVNLAKASEGRKLICFSSDQVYSGMEDEGPYTEERTNPGNLYAKQKLEMENRVLDIDDSAVMLRAEWMYDFISPKGNYFLNVMRAKEKVSFSSKQYRGITYLKEVCESMDRVIALPGGVYNYGSETEKSMYEITRDFLKVINKDIVLEDGEPRHNLWMDCSKARFYGVSFSEAGDGLKKCFHDYNEEILYMTTHVIKSNCS